jgi:hypothetical protein
MKLPAAASLLPVKMMIMMVALLAGETNRFLSGFLSSGLLGTFFGPLADKFGRKRASLMYSMPLP